MNINTEQILETVKGFQEEIPWQYLVVIALIAAVFSALNCFLGYRLRKVWSCLLGIAFGGGGGAAAIYLVLHDKNLALMGGAFCALLFGALAWVLYKFGVFVMCGGLVYATILFIIGEPSLEQCLIALVAWVFAGTLALGYEAQVVIAITAFCGAYGTIHMVFFMTKIHTRAGELVLALVLGIIGAIVQASPFFQGKDLEDGLAGLLPRGKKKKVVHKTKVTHVHKNEHKGNRSSYTKRDSGERTRREPEDSVYTKEEQRYREDLGKTQIYTGQESARQQIQPQNGPYMAPGMGIDLDNLNRELSQEIQKIYQEENNE